MCHSCFGRVAHPKVDFHAQRIQSPPIAELPCQCQQRLAGFKNHFPVVGNPDDLVNDVLIQSGIRRGGLALSSLMCGVRIESEDVPGPYQLTETDKSHPQSKYSPVPIQDNSPPCKQKYSQKG